MLKLPNWEAQFAPITQQRGWGVREGQRTLGDAFIHALNTKTDLLGEAGTGTGKSMVAAVPVIHAIKAARASGRSFRGVISTETITLQDQIVNKDLPDLERTYGGFTYKKLMGRSNYLCLDHAAEKVIGNSNLNNIYMRLEGALSRLTSGEKSDCEAILGRTLLPEEWETMTGSAEFCADNKCGTEDNRCFGARARAEALAADIVVCNHAILATDVQSKERTAQAFPTSELSEGILGVYHALIVDEGHRLVPVFVSQLTESVNGWEIFQMGNHIEAGAAQASNLDPTIHVNELEDIVATVQKVLDVAIEYYSYGVEDWDRAEFQLKWRSLFGVTAGSRIETIMNAFEGEAVPRLLDAAASLEAFQLKIEKALKDATEPRKWAKARKGARNMKKLAEICKVLAESLPSDEGIVSNYGHYGVSIQGYIKKKDNTKGATINMEPLDVSSKIKTLWDGADTSLLMSATLGDPTHKDPFKFIRVSTGFSETAPVVKVASSFDLGAQQVVYITKADRPPVEGGRYSFEELFELTVKMQGRSLILFTSRSDLDTAAMKFRMRQSEGRFPYRILVQEKDTDKKLLAEQFKSDTNSILLGTDSFMTGFDAPGETLSMVALCKFTQPRYNASMRQKISYWRNRGFPNYYKREALLKFEQSAGRLIRSDDCRGVFALLDQAVMDQSSKVFDTAKMGLQMIGSPVTQDQNVVEGFIYGGR